MAEVEGDRSKKHPDCMSFDGQPTGCPEIRDITPFSFEKETYACERCGRRFTLWYDDMA